MKSQNLFLSNIFIFLIPFSFSIIIDIIYSKLDECYTVLGFPRCTFEEYVLYVLEDIIGWLRGVYSVVEAWNKHYLKDLFWQENENLYFYHKWIDSNGKPASCQNLVTTYSYLHNECYSKLLLLIMWLLEFYKYSLSRPASVIYSTEFNFKHK